MRKPGSNPYRFPFRNHRKQLIKLVFSTFSLSKLFIFGAFVALLSPQPILAESLNLPKDTSGWTIFTPSSDTRIMYVSAAGDDSTGEVYSSTSPVVGSNPFNPVDPVSTFRTYAAAFANTRQGYPDWVLFKRGETFYDTVGSNVRSGRSTTEPFLVGAYGESGLSPKLKIGSSKGLSIRKVSSSTPGVYEYIAIQGVRFYAHTRNPDDPEYEGYNGDVGLEIHAHGTGNVIRNLLIEGCAFMYSTNNVIQASGGAIQLSDLDIRRNRFLNTYASGGHAQGLYAYFVNEMLLEENVFDHNGWLVPSYDGTADGGQATMFNHNTYFCSVNNTTLRNNVFMQPSSMNNKFTSDTKSENITINNNLYIDGELGIGIGTNYLDNEFRFISPIISNNVFEGIGRTDPTRRGVAWGLQIAGWDGGEVFKNIILNQGVSAGNSFSISIEDQCRNMDIYSNLFFTPQFSDKGIQFKFAGTSSANTIRDNYIEMPGNGVDLARGEVALSGFTFSNNNYYDSVSPQFTVQNTSYTMAQWQSGFETSAQFIKKSFQDATRSIATYQQSIGKNATVEAFISAVREQGRFNWDTKYTASTVNNWLRAGFFENEEGSTYISAPANVTLVSN
jgi:hypothetical protein